MKNQHNDGTTVTWKNATGATVLAGTLVAIAGTLGVLVADTPNDEEGTLKIDGAFTVPKTAGRAWALGEGLIFHVATGAMDGAAGTPDTGDITGAAIAARAAGSADTNGVIRLTPGNTTIKAT